MSKEILHSAVESDNSSISKLPISFGFPATVQKPPFPTLACLRVTKRGLLKAPVLICSNHKHVRILPKIGSPTPTAAAADGNRGNGGFQGQRSEPCEENQLVPISRSGPGFSVMATLLGSVGRGCMGYRGTDLSSTTIGSRLITS